MDTPVIVNQQWTAIGRLLTIWKSDINDKKTGILPSFNRVVALSDEFILFNETDGEKANTSVRQLCTDTGCRLENLLRTMAKGLG